MAIGLGCLCPNYEALAWGSLMGDKGKRARIVVVTSLLLVGIGFGIGCSGAPGRDAGIRFGAGLSEQSDAQFAARRGARHRRGRAAGAVRLSAEGHRHRHRRRAITENAARYFRRRHHDLFAQRAIRTRLGATITQTLFNGFQTANRTRQAESQVLARARRCASPSRRCCSTRRPPT